MTFELVATVSSHQPRSLASRMTTDQTFHPFLTLLASSVTSIRPIFLLSQPNVVYRHLSNLSATSSTSGRVEPVRLRVLTASLQSMFVRLFALRRSA